MTVNVFLKPGEDKTERCPDVRWERDAVRELQEVLVRKRAKERKKKTVFEVSSALGMVQTVVGGVGVYSPSIMHHPFAVGRDNASSWAS